MTRLPILGRCDGGCLRCCTDPPAVSEEEMVRAVLRANERDIQPRSREGCPWFGFRGCELGDARPAACRGEEGAERPTRFLQEVLAELGDLSWTGGVPEDLWREVDESRAAAGMPPLPPRSGGVL